MSAYFGVKAAEAIDVMMPLHPSRSCITQAVETFIATDVFSLFLFVEEQETEGWGKLGETRSSEINQKYIYICLQAARQRSGMQDTLTAQLPLQVMITELWSRLFRRSINMSKIRTFELRPDYSYRVEASVSILYLGQSLCP